MVELKEDLQHTVDEFGRACGKMNLKINVSKRKVLSGQKGSDSNYKEGESEWEGRKEVVSLKYLGGTELWRKS